MTKQWCGLVVALALFGALPATAPAQSIEVEPYLGAYVPTTNLISQTLEGVPLVGTADFTARQQEALALGARATVWLTTFGVEGNFYYAFSDGEVAVDEIPAEESAGVWAADARVIVNLLPGPLGLHVNGGVALIGRTGDAYAEVTSGKTNVGGVAGAGITFKLPGMFGIRADVDGYFYSNEMTMDDPDLGSITFDSAFQADVVASAGLVISLGP